MDCSITFKCRAHEDYFISHVSGEGVRNYSCGDRIKKELIKKAVFSVPEFAQVAAMMLIHSGLCTEVSLTKGNTLKWKCATEHQAIFTFRLVRNHRYSLFVEAARKAMKYAEEINPVVSVAYFYSKQDRPHLTRETRKRYPYMIRDMVETHSSMYLTDYETRGDANHGFINKRSWENMLAGNEAGNDFAYSRIYPQSNTLKFKQLVEQWKRN